MAKTKQPLEKIPSELRIPKDEAELKLKDRVIKGRKLFDAYMDFEGTQKENDKEYKKWNDYNEEFLKRIFTNEDYYNDYVWSGVDNEYIFEIMEEKLHYIELLIEKLDLIPFNENICATFVSPASKVMNNKKVFIVHGRDELAKTSLEVLLNEMGLESIVLHRQADEGQTIIEKFEKYSDVGYAFILLTPDEIAYFTHEDSLPDDERKKEKRARPNVIFEFGYFVGRLGRNKVCCVYTGDVSLPSDVSAMIYKKYISSVEEVAYSITKDLKAVGIIN